MLIVDCIDTNKASFCPCYSRGFVWSSPSRLLCIRCEYLCVVSNQVKSSQFLTTRQTLAVFLTSILSKRYTNPSSDVITVLAGLDEVDQVISEFVAVLDGIVRNGSSRE